MEAASPLMPWLDVPKHSFPMQSSAIFLSLFLSLHLLRLPLHVCWNAWHSHRLWSSVKFFSIFFLCSLHWVISTVNPEKEDIYQEWLLVANWSNFYFFKKNTQSLAATSSQGPLAQTALQEACAELLPTLFLLSKPSLINELLESHCKQ